MNAVNSHPPTLIVGDWHSRCGACGLAADPDERAHVTVLPGWSGGWFGVGCGVVWTHVRADVASRIGAEERIREMRPDLSQTPPGGKS